MNPAAADLIVAFAECLSLVVLIVFGLMVWSVTRNG